MEPGAWGAMVDSAAGRAPSSGGRTSSGAPWPGTSCTHTPAGMAGETKGRAQPGPGRPPGRARSAQHLAKRAAGLALFAAARPLQCRRSQTPPASHARRHCKRWRATEPQAAAQSRLPATPLNGRHAPTGGRERVRASADLPNKTRHFAQFWSVGLRAPSSDRKCGRFRPSPHTRALGALRRL